jgi:hypothetical protein
MSSRQHVTGDAERATWVPVAKTLSCVECRRAWLAGRERWSVYLIESGDDMPPLTVPFCPACALRLFGDV